VLTQSSCKKSPPRKRSSRRRKKEGDGWVEGCGVIYGGSSAHVRRKRRRSRKEPLFGELWRGRRLAPPKSNSRRAKKKNPEKTGPVYGKIGRGSHPSKIVCPREKETAKRCLPSLEEGSSKSRTAENPKWLARKRTAMTCPKSPLGDTELDSPCSKRSRRGGVALRESLHLGRGLDSKRDFFRGRTR